METVKDYINRSWKKYWDQRIDGEAMGTEKRLEEALNEAQIELLKVLPDEATPTLMNYMDALIDLEIYREKRAFLNGFLSCARIEYCNQMENRNLADIFPENSDTD